MQKPINVCMCAVSEDRGVQLDTGDLIMNVYRQDRQIQSKQKIRIEQQGF